MVQGYNIGATCESVGMVDKHVWGACGYAVWVRVPSLAPKNPDTRMGIWIFYCSFGTRKAEKKTVRWTVFPPWKSPFNFQTHPAGMWMKVEYVWCLKSIGTSALFQKFYKNTRTKKKRTPKGTLLFLVCLSLRRLCDASSGYATPPITATALLPDTS